MREGMTDIRIAKAPCSWGSLEFEGMEGESIAYEQMLDELRDTDYVGTELGDWGYMPTEPTALKASLNGGSLALVGAYVPVPPKNPVPLLREEAQPLQVHGFTPGEAKAGQPSQ